MTRLTAFLLGLLVGTLISIPLAPVLLYVALHRNPQLSVKFKQSPAAEPNVEIP